MSMWSNVTDWLSGAADGLDWGNLLALGGSYMLNQSGATSSQTPPTGYQGGIPEYTVVRAPVPVQIPENYRPGSAGRQYFSDTRYVAPEQADTARTAAQEQAQGIAALGRTNPFIERRPAPMPRPQAPAINPLMAQPASAVGQMMPPPTPQGLAGFQPRFAAGGGIMALAGGKYLNGGTDGMADVVPANIDGRQEARLSDGEFVIPADVVSHLGNGNSDAGAKMLYSMMDRIRQARTGRKEQGRRINPNKYLPA